MRISREEYRSQPPEYWLNLLDKIQQNIEIVRDDGTVAWGMCYVAPAPETILIKELEEQNKKPHFRKGDCLLISQDQLRRIIEALRGF